MHASDGLCGQAGKENTKHPVRSASTCHVVTVYITRPFPSYQISGKQCNKSKYIQIRVAFTQKGLVTKMRQVY